LFVALCVLTVLKARQYGELSQKSAEMQAKIDSQQTALNQQEQKLADQQTAISIVKAGAPGVRPKVIIYHPQVAGRVDIALGELGYNVELRSNLGNPTLADKPVDTLSYGCAVTNDDLRTVAAALAKAELPIRRITIAEKNKDPNLIQLVSSAQTNLEASPLSPETISRPDKPCTIKQPAESKTAGN
jgi:hypothetical protein